MSWDPYFTDGDKPYSENLNDSLMLCDAFDVTVPCSMPDMFNNGDFTSTVNVTRKCGVALVTLKSVDSGVTIGTDEISGTGDVVFRVYPNFNSFYKWSKIIIGKTGTVGISFKKIDGTAISATVGSDGTISETAALKILQEIDVVLTLTNATISNILIEFVNDQTEGRVRTGALLEASQLANVNGTVSSGETKAVNGDTVNSALDSLYTTVSGEIGVLSEEIDTKLASKANKDWTKITVSKGELYINESLKLAHFFFEGTVSFSNSNQVVIQSNNIPSQYAPQITILFLGNMNTGLDPLVVFFIDQLGTIGAKTPNNITKDIFLGIDRIWKY